ncbi:MAG: KH domain-containing protein [Clostridia bacterium]
MKELLEVVAKALVSKPEAVRVKETMNGDTIVLELNVAEDEMGKVIGKQGRIAKSIRTLVKAAALRQEKKVIVEIR